MRQTVHAFLQALQAGYAILLLLLLLKLLNHSKGKLKDGMITATAGYVENSLTRSGS